MPRLRGLGEEVGGEVERGGGQRAEFGELVVSDGDVEGGEVVLELGDGAGADDRGGDLLLLAHPGQGDAGDGGVEVAADPLQRVEQGERVLGEVRGGPAPAS